MESFETNRIGVLRVCGTETDTPALRLAVSAQVAALDIHLPAMPPASVLIVNKMSDPDPGGIGKDNRSLYSNRQWESALNTRLDDAYHSAKSPQSGVLPPDAESVLFVDQAQLLACLLTEMVNGQVHDHWWWRHLLQTNLPAESLSTQIRLTCSDHIDSLPGAFLQLHHWRKAETVLTRLDVADAVAVSLALCQSHDLSDWSGLVAMRAQIESCELPTQGSSTNNSASIDGTGVGQSPGQVAKFAVGGNSSRSSTTVDPWVSWLGAGTVPDHLPANQRLLFGLGLMLHRMPWVLARSEYKRHVAEWLADSALDDISQDSSLPGSRALTSAEGEITADAGQGEASDQDSAEYERHAETGGQNDLQHNRSADELFEDSAKVDRESTQESIDGAWSARPEIVPLEPAIEDSVSAELVAPEYQSLSNGATLQTDLGGVFYLINLIEALDVTSCFEQDWGLASRLSRWALLESLAKSLLGASFETHREDSIWELLADLDDRDRGEAIGVEVLASRRYAIPKSWHAYLSGNEPSFYWAAARGVLRVWTSDQYLLIETSRNHRSPSNQAISELTSYLDDRECLSLSRRALKAAPLGDIEFACGRNAKRWLACVTPALRRFLELKLARDDDGKPFEITQMLRCPGQIYVTPTHIDFVTVLDRISLNARACGLDLDPGWVRQYSRSIKFHFN